MNKEKNSYIFTYSAVMVILVAIALTLANIFLTPAQQANILVEQQWQILKSVGKALDADAQPNKVEYIKGMYEKYIVESFAVSSEGKKLEGKDAFKIDLKAEQKKPLEQRELPVFVYKGDNGESKVIVPIRGNGLWGPVWGYVALEADYNTICGAVFDHEGETPGLGAEINTPEFQKRFVGKKIFEGETFTSVRLIKGGADPSNQHGVDAISGGTLTSNGLDAALSNSLSPYQAFFKSQMKK
ncbi:NADH:ubiquinone reductase (Na(+)-transporting) subunit C [Acetobacteroides hydrogenigenes]|uniref:Na(+)-translocating NADH-quinone reductase subunit C n=1 Tax=Acetobacteroides hydrogenigenes TaxID=979970 RepID=A0A4V2RQD1_9BACT|nr:NADH:ubiquinone reductase (Na(+)-transporting) subunit C [Acetobacteroides hydrogenigenes]TCN70700.1 Na+-transporting NADH:ubiquinone oxidoreductase subunit C [Acetobacteroides hydrogenigenes]